MFIEFCRGDTRFSINNKIAIICINTYCEHQNKNFILPTFKTNLREYGQRDKSDFFYIKMNKVMFSYRKKSRLSYISLFHFLYYNAIKSERSHLIKRYE